MDKLTTKQFGEKVNRTSARVIQLISTGVIEAEKVGDIYLIDPKYVQIVKSLPERRGRKKLKEVAA